MGLLMSWNKSLKENNPKLSWTPQDVKSPDSLTPTACLTHFDFGSQPTDSMKKKIGLLGSGWTADSDNEQRCALDSSVTEIE